MVLEKGKTKMAEEGKSFATFRLRTYNNASIGAFDSHVIAKEAPLLASDNMSKAKQWLQTCIGGHKNCKEFHRRTINTPQQRPTRVLEITKSTIHLRCNMQNERFDYLVLSYMWGNNHRQQLRLLRSNLKDFQKEIPRAEFEASDVYKEAMRVTLALGYKYLWIDSLNIIQDSPEDWAHEARRMAIVYGNATANLAFLFPPHSPTKPNQRDDPRVWNPCVFRAPSSQTPGIYLEHTKSSFRRDYAPEEKAQDWLVQRSWPLFNRAWTFQEYLLAPRTLLLGHKNLMWQCSEGFYDEILGPITEMHATTLHDPKRRDRGKSRYFPETIHELSALTKKRGSLSEPAVLSFMMDWQNLVDEYRSRKLSFGKDRIVAFAGVARAFSNLGQLTYLAGLWWEVIPIALLWYVDKKMVPLVRRENGLQNGGLPSSVWTTEIEESVVQPELPSWSWFSVPIWRYYQLYFLFGDDELAVRCKSYSEPKLVCWDDVFWAEVKGFRNTYSFGHHLKYGNDGWLGPRYQRRCHCGRVYNYIQAFPSFLNTPTKRFSHELRLASAHPDTDEDNISNSCAMQLPIVTPRFDNANGDGLHLMLDLPTELRCYILELLIIDEQFEAYYTLLEHPEIGEVVRCNFNAQFRAVKQHSNLAAQLQQILTTTVLISAHTNKLRSHELAEFLTSNLVDEKPYVSVDSSSQSVAVLRNYQKYLVDAETLTDQFAKITIGNAAVRYVSGDLRRYGADTLSKVEHHRILRAFLRLQLYIEIRKLYGVKKSLKRKLRGLFSLWTTWEFDEVRSLVEWIKIERSSLPKHYARSIRKLFALVDAHFYNDMAPYVKARPDPMRDRHRRSKLAKKSKR
ncbi:hypothetical protein GT037_011190 [Alternaria burnsii]|uniref:Heterokaryon incompatibility domain-containing protein n=1 Tax=Alternaria burnsii TaxID=1187904 RepID=A0A8H7AXB0_9PLEO|nr:uncharacterized protein GT037_011190 [Alternaria burnsii]KAF7670739.1 hypothetical protein GT037_011190 [Alternaria burnsii]